MDLQWISGFAGNSLGIQAGIILLPEGGGAEGPTDRVSWLVRSAPGLSCVSLLCGGRCISRAWEGGIAHVRYLALSCGFRCTCCVPQRFPDSCGILRCLTVLCVIFSSPFQRASRSMLTQVYSIVCFWLSFRCRFSVSFLVGFWSV